MRMKTSLKIEEELWFKFKIFCIKKKVAMSELIEKLIEREIKK